MLNLGSLILCIFFLRQLLYSSRVVSVVRKKSSESCRPEAKVSAEARAAFVVCRRVLISLASLLY